LTKSLVTTGGFFSTIKAQKTSLFPNLTVNNFGDEEMHG
jgi:hypothetical protein